MHINELKQSRFLKQEDVVPPALVTIIACKKENVAMEGADPEYRWVLVFKELDKPMTLNWTNGQLLAQITGSEESDNWIGKKVVLYKDPAVSFGGRIVGGIRIRSPELHNVPVETPKNFDQFAKENPVEKDEPPI